MNAFYLHKPDGAQTEISLCGVCGSIALGGNYEMSEQCCACLACGKPLSDEERAVHKIYHRDCESRQRAERERARLEKAETVAAYDDPVYCEAAGRGSLGEGFFSSPEELSEHLDSTWKDASSRPAYAFCCESKPIELDFDYILEDATQEAFDGAIEELVSLVELRAAIEAFNKANESVVTFDVDYERKVAIPPEAIVRA